MSSSKVCKNLAEEDRRQKALKKEKKAIKKWKWTTTHNEQSFKKEDQLLVQGLFRKDDKCVNPAAEITAHKDKGIDVVDKLECMSLVSRPNPALSPRDAATDDESEEGVFESLLDDPILSSSIAEEITIADEITITGEESGIKSWGPAEEDEPDESSDEEEDEEGDENDVVEEENKRGNGNNLKNLPCNGECAKQEFHGCDDKCIAEDLTPYQNSKRCMGEYFCAKCNSRWQSASSNANRSQRCPDCEQDIFPHWQRPLDDWEARAVSRASHSGHDTCFRALNKGKRTSLKKRRAVSRKTNLKMRVAR